MPPASPVPFPGWMLLAQAQAEGHGLKPAALAAAGPAAGKVSAPAVAAAAQVVLEIPAAEWQALKLRLPELDRYRRGETEPLARPARVASQTVLNELGGAAAPSGRIWESWFDDDVARPRAVLPGAGQPYATPGHGADTMVEPGQAQVFRPTTEDVVAALDVAGTARTRVPPAPRQDVPPLTAVSPLIMPRRLHGFALGAAAL
ncbi:MAG TPA: hypothetical protein PKE19_11030, partial [Aestuariivirga sp.]|nr:hypothetical protein [Aestuariivirga sp.]